MAIEPAQLESLVRILGWRPSSFSAVDGGYTPALRYSVASGDRRAFVKIAPTPNTAMLLRREIKAYRAVKDQSLRPALLGDEDGTVPILIIEDLGDAVWPPPWTDAIVAAALATIGRLHNSHAELPSFAALHGEHRTGWSAVRAAPAPFLGLGLVSAAWLTAALPALIEAESACPTDGTSVTHWDLRSDNMCFQAGSMKLIDWAEACLSNPKLDLGFWLPSLSFEGGPPPEAILPNSPEIAAWVSGYFAARAGLPEIPDAPFVRRVQRQQLSQALPWVQRALRLGAA